tara:strand:+ start:2961 stop:3182 length:222 start_codon:yes stop_codon:yes gene_type:complete
MKLNITRPNGTVRFILDTKFFTNALLILLIFVAGFTMVWSFAIPPFFYDIALSMLITWKLIPRILRRSKNEKS